MPFVWGSIIELASTLPPARESASFGGGVRESESDGESGENPELLCAHWYSVDIRDLIDPPTLHSPNM